MRVVVMATLLSLLLAASAATTHQNRREASPRRQAAAPPCRLTLGESPEVRGLRLRQLEAEALALFPALKKYTGEDLGRTEYSHITVVGEEARNPTALRGVDMLRLTFLDGRLYYIVLSYNEYEPASVSDFVRQASATMDLPTAGWRREGASAVLECSGFEVWVQTGKEGGRHDYPSLIISDKRAEAEYRRRYETRQAERRREEEERRRREEQRRRVFKP